MDTKELQAMIKIIKRFDDNEFDVNVSVSQKYKIISLFLDPKYKLLVKSAQKNHSGLNKEKMTYLVTEAFVKLFIGICKLSGNPLGPLEQGKVSSGAFRRLIESQQENMDELLDELETVKAGGWIDPKEHKKLLEREYRHAHAVGKAEGLAMMDQKLEEQEKYYKEKISKQIKRHSEGQQYLTKEVDKLSKEVIEY